MPLTAASPALSLVSEAVAKGAIEAAFVAGIMYQFVKQSAVIVRRIGAEPHGILLTDVYTGTWDLIDAAEAKTKMRDWVGLSLMTNTRGE